MTEQISGPTTGEIPVPLDDETLEFAQQIADSVASFLLALRAIAREADGGRAISLLLLEISQVLLAGGLPGLPGGDAGDPGAPAPKLGF